MNRFSYSKINNNRQAFLRENRNVDHFFCINDSKILISAPHGVSQVRLGKLKHAETGSLNIALELFNRLNTCFIAKTKNNFDDANFDQKSKYKDCLNQIIKSQNIKYLIDFHGLNKTRPCDINLGIHLGKNIETDTKLFDELVDILNKHNLKVCIDQPFMANSNTISSSAKEKYPNLWAIQVEINCLLTNKRENKQKMYNILDSFIDFIKLLDKKIRKSQK